MTIYDPVMEVILSYMGHYIEASCATKKATVQLCILSLLTDPLTNFKPHFSRSIEQDASARGNRSKKEASAQWKEPPFPGVETSELLER